MNRFCPQCGTRLDTGAAFCDACGAPQAAGNLASQAPSDSGPAALAGDTAAATAQRATSGQGGSGTATTEPSLPRRRSWWLPIVAVALLALSGLGYVAASPYLALREARAAIERGKIGEVLAMVDREALKRNLAQGAQGALQQLLADDAELGISSNFMLQALADGGGKGLAEGIDRLLSPESLRQLEDKLAGSGSIEEAMFGREGPQGKDAEYVARLKDGLTTDYGYTGLNTFELRLGHEEIGSAKLLLQREGLVGWKVAGVDAGDLLPAILRQAGLATDEKKLAQSALRQRKLDAAQRWLAVLARRGDDEARYRLAVLQLAGVPGQPAQADEGVRNAELAAQKNHLRAAQVLARAYQDGVGVAVDLDRALHWLKRAHEIEPLDRWAAALAGLYARKGDQREALAWIERALSAPAHLTRAERGSRQGSRLVEARKQVYLQYAQDLRQAIDAGGAVRAPRWVAALAGSGAPHAAGWGPLSLGMRQPDAIAILGEPSRFEDRGRQGIGLVYDHFMPQGAYLALDFDNRGALKKLTLSVLPEGAGLGLPVVGRVDPDVAASQAVAGPTVLALGCPADGGVLTDYMLAELDLFPTRAKRVKAGDAVLRVCGNGFVAGMEIGG